MSKSGTSRKKTVLNLNFMMTPSCSMRNAKKNNIRGKKNFARRQKRLKRNGLKKKRRQKKGAECVPRPRAGGTDGALLILRPARAAPCEVQRS